MPLNIFPAACLTNWGAVLGVVKEPLKSGSIYCSISNSIWVADPDAIDAGETIGTNEIKLLWRIKPERWFVYYEYCKHPKLQEFDTIHDALAWDMFNRQPDLYKIIFLYEKTNKIIYKNYCETFLEEFFHKERMNIMFSLSAH